MRNLRLLVVLIACICVLTAVAVAGYYLKTQREPAWMVDPDFRHGLEDVIADLRAMRAIQPPAGFIHQEEVVWARHEDGTGANLEDGRMMRLGKGNADYWTAINWKPGTKLMLYYSEKEGVMLVEPTKGVIFKVDVIYGRHPLDSYQEEIEKHVSSSAEATALSNDMHRLWGLEADRCVREVLESPHVPSDVKANVVHMTHARAAYMGAYGYHLSACIDASYKGGPMRAWDSAEFGKRDARFYAQQLLLLRAYLSDFEPQAGDPGAK